MTRDISIVDVVEAMPTVRAHGGPSRNWHQRHQDSLTVGQRAADRMRDWMGSWTFIVIFLGMMALWVVVNLTMVVWDPYPFILLNLFLSMMAGLQGAILLIAAKRQDAVAAALAAHDFDTNRAAKIEIEDLMAISRRQLEILQALQSRVGDSASGVVDHEGTGGAPGAQVVERVAGAAEAVAGDL